MGFVGLKEIGNGGKWNDKEAHVREHLYARERLEMYVLGSALHCSQWPVEGVEGVGHVSCKG